MLTREHHKALYEIVRNSWDPRKIELLELLNAEINATEIEFWPLPDKTGWRVDGCHHGRGRAALTIAHAAIHAHNRGTTPPKLPRCRKERNRLRTAVRDGCMTWARSHGHVALVPAFEALHTEGDYLVFNPSTAPRVRTEPTD